MIRVLDQHTIDKIAAGEVIERPASVVKELVENSIDAGATRVTIEITDGGTSMIRVTDNGSGIDADDVRKAYYSHATSKLDTIDDLMNITSLGFRGEALSTIAAVSEVEMVTKTHDALTGIRYVIEAGKELEFKEIGAPDGTTIISRNLFFNTPARKKFLKSNMTEGSYINDLIVHIALANPGVAIKLISGGKTIVDTQGDGRLKETVYSLFGKDITRGLLEVDYTHTFEDGEIKLTGFVGKPFISKGNRSFENYFVNKRYIKSAVVNRAIEEAYKTHIMQHRFPYTALFIEVPTYMVDVNVHPAKREFRFDNEKELFSGVFHAVKNALENKEFIPDTASDYTVPKPVKQPVPETKLSSVASNKIPQPDMVVEEQNRYSSNTLDKIDHKNPSNILDRPKSSTSENSFSILESLLPKEYREKLGRSVEESVSNTNTDNPIENTSESTASPKFEFKQEELTETRYLSEEARPKHRIIGLAFDTYWITEYEDCLYLMDQHAAHEKVNYETFLKEFKERKIHSQNIFPPEIFTMTSREKEAVLSKTDYMQKFGFEIEDFGGNEIKVSAVPANLLGLGTRDVFMELADYITNDLEDLTEDIFVRKLATMGCKAAVKGNQKITFEEVQTLMDRLMSLDNPYTCPHGRPTIIKMTKTELDKKFKRIVE
ncbi:MAG: DNA mismatch repair endonuclease MutL [Eubacterium sp.]|nr:DNA mismatch repair endonuclease MutL [Eubacterium sp.]